MAKNTQDLPPYIRMATVYGGGLKKNSVMALGRQSFEDIELCADSISSSYDRNPKLERTEEHLCGMYETNHPDGPMGRTGSGEAN